MRLLSDETKQGIIEFVNRYYAENGYTPTIAVIADALRLAPPTIHKYLHRMNEAGELSFDGRHIATEYISGLVGQRSATVSGEIACGTPAFAEQTYGERIMLPASLVGNGEYFILTANGQSMQNIGIDSGDLVVIRKQNYADEGQIVAALIHGEEATLKRYMLDRQSREVVLLPENDDFQEQRYAPEDVLIQGVAVYVMKKVV